MNKSKTILYFAYGSNLSISQMKQRCPKSKLLHKGYLRDYKLVFSRYSSIWHGSVADVIRVEGRHVWGLLYEMPKDDLKSLDSFEGFPRMYNRKLMTIYNEKSQPTKNVWIYYIVHKFKNGRPAKRYLDIIKTAAFNFNFPKYYQAALSIIKPIIEPVKTYETFLIKDAKPIFTTKTTAIGLKGLPLFEQKLDGKKNIFRISKTSSYTVDDANGIDQDFEDEQIERMVRDNEFNYDKY